MERQLKERLIGAAVLIAIVVILVPEMFSGSPRTTDPDTPDVVNSGQLKTYQIDLQASSVTAPPVEEASPLVESPMPEPVSELQSSASVAAVTVEASNVEASSSSTSSSSHSSTSRSTSVAASQPAVPTVSTSVNNRAGNWAVQIGSFGTQDRAQQIVAKLKSMGVVAAITPVKAGGKILYRVRTDGLAERAAADNALKKIRATYPDASVVPII
ncbi:MAG: SPOR domain-containing protein [Steroidobacteraceae bacterium]